MSKKLSKASIRVWERSGNVWISFVQNCCWSLLGLKALNESSVGSSNFTTPPSPCGGFPYECAEDGSGFNNHIRAEALFVCCGQHSMTALHLFYVHNSLRATLTDNCTSKKHGDQKSDIFTPGKFELSECQKRRFLAFLWVVCVTPL